MQEPEGVCIFSLCSLPMSYFSRHWAFLEEAEEIRSLGLYRTGWEGERSQFSKKHKWAKKQATSSNYTKELPR